MIDRNKPIELLNRAIAAELTAVHQYMYFHFLLDDMGYDMLSSYFRNSSISEMIHVERLAERILFLKGEVEMTLACGVEKIHDVKQMIMKAEQMEQQSVEDYNRWARECGDALDSVSKKLFEELVVEEEEHLSYFDKEIENLKKYGDSYLALQSIEHSKKKSMPQPLQHSTTK